MKSHGIFEKIVFNPGAITSPGEIHLIRAMIITTKDKKQVLLRRLAMGDVDKLLIYLEQLSAETKRRFGPHQFDKQSIADLYTAREACLGYIATVGEAGEIVAYSIIKPGYLEHDSYRLRSYGFTPHSETDCTFAPSVADAWQSQGVGDRLFHFILADLKSIGIKRIILWGGVQRDNSKAVNFYKKHGFQTLGKFEYYGWNYDMVLVISSSEHIPHSEK